MDVPEHLRRFPTRSAIDSLARRFDLPNDPSMQDWEWEVADPGRLDEFLEVYDGDELSDDERFTLMEMILESFESLARVGALDDRWQQTLSRIESNIELHAHSVWYWSRVGADDPDEQFHISRSLRTLLARHDDRLAPGGEPRE